MNGSTTLPIATPSALCAKRGRDCDLETVSGGSWHVTTRPSCRTPTVSSGSNYAMSALARMIHPVARELVSRWSRLAGQERVSCRRPWRQTSCRPTTTPGEQRQASCRPTTARLPRSRGRRAGACLLPADVRRPAGQWRPGDGWRQARCRPTVHVSLARVGLGCSK
jgi:hypothetical protein